MEEQTSVTYDDMVQTRNVQMLKSIIPFLDFPSQKPAEREKKEKEQK